MHRRSFVFSFEDSAVGFLKASAHLTTPFGKTYASLLLASNSCFEDAWGVLSLS
jgi:hypothetical protein